MHAFVLIQKNIPIEELDPNKFEEQVPFLADVRRIWKSQSKKTCCMFWGQNSTLYPENSYYKEEKDGVTFFDGFIWPIDDDISIESTASTIRNRLKHSSVDSFRVSYQGEYLVVHVHHDQAWTIPDPMSLEPCFYYADKDIVIISNRIGLIQEFVPETKNIDSFNASFHVAWGVMPEGFTPFNGIHSLQIGTVYFSKEGRLEQKTSGGHPITSIPTNVDIDPDSEEYWNGLIDRLSRNLDFIEKAPVWVELGLSGGKDSRLILALALHRGVADSLSIFTLGVDEDPDVIVAKEITSNFGLFHICRRPAISKGVDINRIHDEAFPKHQWLLEGMHTVWDPHARGVREEKVILTGLNGDWYRSSFDAHGSDTSWVKTEQDAIKFFSDSIFLDPANLLIDEIREAHLEYRRNWVSKMAQRGVTPSDMPNLFYIMNQSSRRNANFRKADGLIGHLVDVLLTNDLYVLGFSQGAKNRRRERIHYRLMSMLSPWLTKHHFAKDQWHADFLEERRTPSPGPVLPFYRQRKRIAMADWRTYINNDSSYRKKCKKLLLDRGYNDGLFEFAERKKIERFFSKRKNSKSECMGLYGLFTVALLLDRSAHKFKVQSRGGQLGSIVRFTGENKIYRVLRGKAHSLDTSSIENLGIKSSDISVIDAVQRLRLSSFREPAGKKSEVKALRDLDCSSEKITERVFRLEGLLNNYRSENKKLSNWLDILEKDIENHFRSWSWRIGFVIVKLAKKIILKKHPPPSSYRIFALLEKIKAWKDNQKGTPM